MRYLWIIVAMTLAGCMTPKVWDKGFAPDGKDLKPDERMAEYARFAPKSIDQSGALIRRGSEMERYTKESFTPVAADLDHSIPALMDQGVWNSWLATGFFCASIALSGRLLDATRDNSIAAWRHDRTRVVVALGLGASLGFRYYFDGQSGFYFGEATRTYVNALDRRIFPQ